MSPDAVVLAAAGVGFGHAVLPDHWVPLAALARTQRYPLRRVAKLSTAAGAAHVAVSLVLGAVIVIVGLQLRSTVESAQNVIVGGLLVVTGVVFLALELTGRGHGHPHDHAHDHSHAQDHHDHPHDHHDHVHRPPRMLAVLVPFGAAASPDLTILPVFLAATATGALTAVGALVAFAAVTILTMLTLTLLATLGGYGLPERWLDRWGNRFTAGVLIVIGALVLAGVL
jgi:hypothetical protein